MRPDDGSLALSLRYSLSIFGESLVFFLLNDVFEVAYDLHL